MITFFSSKNFFSFFLDFILGWISVSTFRSKFVLLICIHWVNLQCTMLNASYLDLIGRKNPFLRNQSDFRFFLACSEKKDFEKRSKRLNLVKVTSKNFQVFKWNKLRIWFNKISFFKKSKGFQIFSPIRKKNFENRSKWPKPVKMTKNRSKWPKPVKMT